jgi:DNA-binding beta-propeller fold protein YncE
VALDVTTTNLYVTDSRAGQVIKLNTSGSNLVVKSGLAKPLAVAVGNQGLVYVGEEGTGRVLVFNSALTNALYFLGIGSNEFQLANHIAVDTTQSNGWIYVSDSKANQIKCYTNSALVKSFGTKGSGNGQFNFPAGVYVSPSQELYVVDQNNDRVQVFNRTGAFQRVFYLKTPADLVTTNIYGRAQGILGDSAGRIYVMDAFQGEIKVFDTVGTYLATLSGWGEWIGQLRTPGSAALGTDQRLFVASINNNRMEIFSIQGGSPVYVTLQVVSTYGTPTPTVGIYSNVSGSVLTNFVNLTDLRGQTQFVNIGWALTGNGPTSGTTNSMIMTHTNNAVLTWNWKTQYSLALTAGVHGVVSASSVWWDQGSTAMATATPDIHFHFNVWTGTVSSVTNPLPVLMNIPHSIVALFDPTLATNSTPEWWLASFNLTGQTYDAQALGDDDGDGVLTWQEFIADTVPTNALSFLAFSKVDAATSRIELAWHGGILATQMLEKAALLTGTAEHLYKPAPNRSLDHLDEFTGDQQSRLLSCPGCQVNNPPKGIRWRSRLSSCPQVFLKSVGWNDQFRDRFP